MKPAQIYQELKELAEKRFKDIHEKIELLAECLSEMPHEEMYIIPAVRELLKK